MAHYSTLQFKALIFLILIQFNFLTAQQKFSKRQIQKIKTATLEAVDSRHKNTQVMIDKVFSFAELGFQEYESSAYLVSILEAAGFEVEKGILRKSKTPIKIPQISASQSKISMLLFSKK